MKRYQSPDEILDPVRKSQFRGGSGISTFPEDTLDTLEYPSVREQLRYFISGIPAKPMVDASRPSVDLSWIRERLDEAEEMKQMLESGHSIPVGQYPDVTEDLYRLQVEGYRLEIDRILAIKGLIDQLITLAQASEQLPLALHPSIKEYWKEFPGLNLLKRSIASLFDSEGNIRSDASPKLVKLAEQQRSIRKSMEDTFSYLLKTYRDRGWLSEAPETIRNGRKVFSVPSEHRNKIDGIVHDQSSSGKTSYIEPRELIGSNNTMFQLDNEKKREVHRLISKLCDALRQKLPKLVDAYRRLVSIDLILAKARFAQEIDGRKPEVHQRPALMMIGAIHPLLYLHHKGSNKPTVPSDISLYGNNRILLLSGPNAGGKSVALKTAGVLQLMIQSGWLVPASEESTFGMFEQFFIDIGDQQSLADDLSTYSSHLKNLKYFLDNADDRSLLLLDEFGSGTDPKLGGAMAEAVLHELKKKGVYGLVTTHYSNLKVYAHRVKGIVNGSLAFDKEQLKPVYELHIGKPGSSYAFELAEQNGIPAYIIERARKNAGEDITAVEDLVIQLQNEKHALEKKLEQTKALEDQLDRMRKNFDHLHREMEIRRKKLKLRKKEVSMREKGEARQILEEKIREWSEEERTQKAKEEVREMKEDQKALGDEVTEIKDELFEEEEAPGKEWKEGDFVKTRDGSFTGTIHSIQKDRAEVISGTLKLSIPLRDLRSAKEPLEKRSQSSVQAELSRETGSMGYKLDLRGLRRKEALKIFEQFMEDALMADKSRLEIIHGRGEGILRKAIHEKIREYGNRHQISHPDEEHGGDGVTFIALK